MQDAVTPSLKECNINGSGTFSWLIKFDKKAGTITTGGAKPVHDPRNGYSFLTETISGFAIAPIVLNATVGANGDFSITTDKDVIVPIFLDESATTVVLLPLKQAKMSGTISADNNCIGSYNAAGLEPAKNCIGDDKTRTFLNGGKLSGYILLEDADKIKLTTLPQTLCVLLSGTSDGGSPVAKCKRDANNKILFQGDWCAATNSPATPTCSDASSLVAEFAASSVKLN